MQNHPGVAKAWASFPGTFTGTLTSALWYNVTSITHLGTGTYSVALTTAMADTAYAIAPCCAPTAVMDQIGGTRKVGGIMLAAFASATGAATDVGDGLSFVIFGNQ